VGIFDFLKGKKDEVAERGEASTGVIDPPRAEPGPLAPDAARPDTTGVAAEGATEGGAGFSRPGSDTPFTPPEAWNIDALMTPPPEATGDKPEMGPVDPARTAALQGPIIEALKTVYDPEIPVDIYELGLIYEILVDADNRVLVRMTLTSPACPSAQQIPSEVRYKIKALPEVQDAWVEIVWEPPWDKDRMSEAARLQLGFM
jgi:FeS assembly SUF system protein